MKQNVPLVVNVHVEMLLESNRINAIILVVSLKLLLLVKNLFISPVNVEHP